MSEDEISVDENKATDGSVSIATNKQNKKTSRKSRRSSRKSKSWNNDVIY
jgi:hypothetical protein